MVCNFEGQNFHGLGSSDNFMSLYFCGIPTLITKLYTINWENFKYENIHVLNVSVNKFLWVPHKNILTRKFCQVEITVHVLPI